MICLEQEIRTCRFCNKELTKFQKKYCSHSCQFKKFNIDQNSKKEYFMPTFTQEMHEIFEGIMLSDGNLEVQKSTNYPRFVLTQGEGHKEYCDYFCKLFRCDLDRVTYKLKYHKKTGKYHDSWSFATLTSPVFTEYFNRWYKYCPVKQKMVKFIPLDFKITPLSLMHEFLGDGHCSLDGNRPRIGLATHCFSQESIRSILFPQFNRIGISPTMQKRPNITNISNKLSIYNFFKYIGKTSPIQCYNYKFSLIQHLIV